MNFAQSPTVAARSALSGAQHRPFWLDHPDRPEVRSPLEGPAEADLVVVGAGLSGLWTALRAVEREPGRKVVLLEAGRIANAASGRNGGFVASSITHGYLNGVQRWPDEFATLYRLGVENLEGIERTIERYGIDCGYQRTGDLQVATQQYQVEDLREHHRAVTAAGAELDLLDREQTRGLVDSPTYLMSLRDPYVGLVDPARLSWGLAAAAAAAGVTIHEHSAVTGIRRRGAGLRVSTHTGHVDAHRVALTTAAHAPLLRRISAYVLPVFDHVVVTEPLPDDVLASIGWHGRYGVGDAGGQFHYYRLTADNRILWGGYDAVYQRGERPGSTLERDDFLTARLVTHLHQTFPQVAGLGIDYAWAGAIDTCSRFCAFWGSAFAGRLAYVVGYTGLGVGASRFGADTLLDLLSGLRTSRTDLQMVGSKPLPFPPEPIRQVVVDATRWSIAEADAHEGRRNLWLRTLDRLGLGFDS